jgi:hypothetical protein
VLKAGGAVAKIEEMLTLSKGQKARALETIIEQILSNPLIFVFGEFLSQQNFIEVSLFFHLISSLIVGTSKQASGHATAICL